MTDCCDNHHEHKTSDHTQKKVVSQEDIIYTCPMHPEIRQPDPGNCPICGMALEPEVITGEEKENLELTDFRRRFWIGL
nr:hypothetical protein [Candidatus Dadabacteria bacterium]NIQ15285.1 hypothetical protein [Candidatus Dadabacteria bacterium]